MSLLFQPQAPVLAPTNTGDEFPVRRIFCVGRNYAAHAREMGFDPDREPPFYFNKTPADLVMTGATVPYAPGTQNLHYAMELVIAIRKPAFRVGVDKALDCVWGYACGLDMTRRDLQNTAKQMGRPWDFGKDFENSAVMSPLVPAAGIGHPAQGASSCRSTARSSRTATSRN